MSAKYANLISLIPIFVEYDFTFHVNFKQVFSVVSHEVGRHIGRIEGTDRL